MIRHQGNNSMFLPIYALLRNVMYLFLRCFRPRRLLLTVTLTTILILNAYFILSLLNSQRAAPAGVRRYNHGSNRYNHGLNAADRVMLGEDDYSYMKDTNGATQFKKFSAEKYSNKCTILKPSADSIINQLSTEKTPFKIYIYDLPPELNSRLSSCVTKFQTAACYRSDYCGFGPVTGTNIHGLTIHGTWQFNLEVILHHQLLYSPYRIHNASQAEVFYVPYYPAHACYCYSGKIDEIEKNIAQLVEYLENSPYYRAGRPHLTTISKIEREHFAGTCPLLKHINNDVFRVIGIEEELASGVKRAYSQVSANRVPLTASSATTNTKF